jgi:hypothetical protein
VAHVTSPAAYLRVYEPMAAFPPADRARWERYAAAGAPSRAAGSRRERDASLLAAVRPTLDIDHEGALVQRVDGLLHICPMNTQIRVWQAAMEFRGELPEQVAEAFLPRRIAEPAEAELERWRTRRPDLKVHVQISLWLVPLQWFVAFEAGERSLVVGTGVERSLVYTTRMTNARRRVARALSVLRRTIPDAPTVDGLVELGRWLEDFHPHSWVELDYGGLVDLLDDEELRTDASVADLAEALQALAEGHSETAASAYERVMGRWRPLSSRETAS